MIEIITRKWKNGKCISETKKEVNWKLNEADFDRVIIKCDCGNKFNMPWDATFGIPDIYCGHCGKKGKMKVWSKTMTKPTTAEVRIIHCDNCGGDWVDNGLQSGCQCKLIINLEAKLEATERELKLETAVRKQAVSDLNDMTKVAEDQADKLESAKQEIKNCHADIDQLREIDNERLNVEIPALEAKLADVKEIIRTQKKFQYDEWVVREDDLLEVLDKI